MLLHEVMLRLRPEGLLTAGIENLHGLRECT